MIGVRGEWVFRLTFGIYDVEICILRYGVLV